MRCDRCPCEAGLRCPGEHARHLCDRVRDGDTYWIEGVRRHAALSAGAALPPPPEPWGTRPTDLRREIVVARYREDVSWLEGARDWVTLYDKGGRRPELAVPHCWVPLPNTGREAGTWLHHIVTHYHDLADWTFLVQGGAPEHQADILERIAASWSGPTCLSTRYTETIPPQWIKDRDLQWREAGFELRLGDARIDGHVDDSVGPSRKWFNEAAWSYLFDAPIPEQVWFCYTAQWALRREDIHVRPRSFYQHLMRALEQAGNGGQSWTDPPINPWSLEALWRYVWDPRYPVHEAGRAETAAAEGIDLLRRVKACPDFVPPRGGCGCVFGQCRRTGKPTTLRACKACLESS